MVNKTKDGCELCRLAAKASLATLAPLARAAALLFLRHCRNLSGRVMSNAQSMQSLYYEVLFWKLHPCFSGRNKPVYVL
jgi:hypothetical protein